MVKNLILKPAIRVNIILYTRKYTINSLKTYQGGSYESDFFSLNRSFPNTIITVYVLTCLIDQKNYCINYFYCTIVYKWTNKQLCMSVCLFVCLGFPSVRNDRCQQFEVGPSPDGNPQRARKGYVSKGMAPMVNSIVTSSVWVP